MYKVCKPCHVNVLCFILAIIVRTIRDLHSRIRIRIRFNAKMGAYTQGWGRAYNQINFVCFQVRMGLQLGRVVNEGRGAAYKQKFKVSFCNQDNISRVFLRLWCHERRFL